MNKKIKVFICLFCVFFYFLFVNNSFAKYVIESTSVVAKLNLDTTPPSFELVDIKTSNTDNPKYINKTHFVSGHFKLVEKNILRNSMNVERFLVLVNGTPVPVDFSTFSLVSKTSNECLYEFSFTNVTGNGLLSITILESTVSDKSGFINPRTTFNTLFIVNNSNSITNSDDLFQQSSTSTLNDLINTPPSQVSESLDGNNSLENDFVESSDSIDDTLVTQSSEIVDEILPTKKKEDSEISDESLPNKNKEFSSQDSNTPADENSFYYKITVPNLVLQ